MTSAPEPVPAHVRAGGPDKLRALLQDFYERVFADVMIGFLFRGKDRVRLVDKELELVLSVLGADVVYTGKSMRAAHAPLRIFGGHFERRQQILRETCDAHALPPDIRDLWLAHNESLRSQVTSFEGSECE